MIDVTDDSDERYVVYMYNRGDAHNRKYIRWRSPIVEPVQDLRREVHMTADCGSLGDKQNNQSDYDSGTSNSSADYSVQKGSDIAYEEVTGIEPETETDVTEDPTDRKRDQK